MTPSATNYQRPLSLAHSFAGRDSQRVLLHSEPHRLSNKSDIVQVAGVLALGGIWPPKLNTHTYVHVCLTPVYYTAYFHHKVLHEHCTSISGPRTLAHTFAKAFAKICEGFFANIFSSKVECMHHDHCVNFNFTLAFAF